MKLRHLLVGLLFTGPLIAQPTATDLSYYPLQVGNIWLYREMQWTPQGTNPTGVTVRSEIIGVEQRANGKWYAVFDRGQQPARIDSATGEVFLFDPQPGAYPPCADSAESLLLDLTVTSASGYLACGGWTGGTGWDVTSLGATRVAQLYISRPIRVWNSWLSSHEYAEGIGLCRFYGPGYTDKRYELIFAHINGTDYFPVQLRSFTGDVLPDGGVLLRWTTEQETGSHGFIVERSRGTGEDWRRLAFVPSTAGEGGGADYVYEDPASGLVDEGPHSYRLCQQDLDGSIEYSPVIDFAAGASPLAPGIEAWPNPASGPVSIRRAGADGDAVILIVDLLGREIRRFGAAGGTGTLTWDLTDSSGRPVPAGTYLLRLFSGAASATRVIHVRR